MARWLVIALLLGSTTVGAGADKPVSLKGSPEALLAQNRQANREKLSRLEDEMDLALFRQKNLLVPLPQSKGVRVDPRLDGTYAYVRPWTRRFLVDLGAKSLKRFGRPIQANSGIRTELYQRRLGRRNGNAAPVRGPKASSHLTGSTVDIAKRGMSVGQLRWMRRELLRLERLGLIEATEEFRQPVFHVMVYRHYGAKPVGAKKAAVRKAGKPAGKPKALKAPSGKKPKAKAKAPAKKRPAKPAKPPTKKKRART